MIATLTEQLTSLQLKLTEIEERTETLQGFEAQLHARDSEIAEQQATIDKKVSSNSLMLS